MALNNIYNEPIINSSAQANVSRETLPNHNPPSTLIDRDSQKMNTLHEPKGISKIVDGATELGGEAINTSAKILVKGSGNFIQTIRNAFVPDTNGKRSFQKIFLLIFLAVMGVFTAHSGVGLFGNLFSTEYRKKHAPTLFVALKLILGLTLMTGAARFLGDKGNFLNFQSLGWGSAALAATHAAGQVFESPNSLPAKLCSFVGVDTMAKNVMSAFGLTKNNYSGLI